MENFAKKLGWPFEGSAVPSHSSVADTTEDAVARVVKKELAHFGGGGNTGTGNTGSVANQESLAKLLGLWFVRSETKPPATMHGVPVVWVDPSGKAQPAPVPVPATPGEPEKKVVTPAAPTFSSAGKSYTIPTTEGVTYQVEGRDATGTVTVEPPKNVTITAKPKAGYVFAVGAPVSWSYAFEAATSAFDDAVMPLTSYLRLDDAPGTTEPRDRGTAPLTLISKYSDRLVPGGAGIGVGATSAKANGSGSVVAQYAPSGVTSFTIGVLVKVNRAATNAVRVGALWDNSMPRFFFFTTKGAGTSTVDFDYKGTGTVTKNPATNLAIADGDLALLAVTFDGSTLRGWVNGAEAASIPWAGNTSGNVFLRLVDWTVQDNQDLPLAGLFFQKNEVKSSAWMKAALAAAKRGA